MSVILKRRLFVDSFFSQQWKPRGLRVRDIGETVERLPTAAATAVVVLFSPFARKVISGRKLVAENCRQLRFANRGETTFRDTIAGFYTLIGRNVHHPENGRC
jgi:hypothetical protein